MKKNTIPVYWIVLAIIGFLILATWPLEYQYFSSEAILGTYFQWRVITLSGFVIILTGLIVSDFIRRHVYWVLYCGLLAEVALTGYLFGQVKSITLETPWFYVNYIFPFMTIVIYVRIGRRIAATLLLPIVYLLFFLLDRTGSGYWGYEHLGVTLNIVFSTSLLSILLGHVIYHLNRSNFLQSRQRKIQQKKIKELANHDLLTGLYNRREFENRFNEEFTRSQRYDKDFTLLMIDLDHFKNVNDTYGHQAGDRVLEKMGEIISEETRHGDIPSRFGGEEFSIGLIETGLADARKLGERLRRNLSEQEFESNGETFTASCSIGVTEVLPEDETFEDTLKRADKALYDAKAKGRNCLVCTK
ncbi:MAG: diguanylate cyclase [bacterium]